MQVSRSQTTWNLDARFVQDNETAALKSYEQEAVQRGKLWLVLIQAFIDV